MCCFSGTVKSVSDTRIFARGTADGRQCLAYSMRLDTAADVAMVLPIPVAAGAAQDAVKFIDLSAVADFFWLIEATWPQPAAIAAAPAPESRATTLAVQEVGVFEASFVPTLADFARLDARFRLPGGTWEKLPRYRSHGFVVFKLKAGASDVHPMAFSFPRADTNTLFFPTVHIHDGVVHERAHFDHVLYVQGAHHPADGPLAWSESDQVGQQVLRAGFPPGLIDPLQHFFKCSLRGDGANQDIVVAAG